MIENKQEKTGLLGYLRNCFFTGLLVIAPILITFYIIKFTVTLVDNAVTSLFPPKYAPSNYLPYDIPGIELIFGAVALLIFGVLVRNFIGAKLVAWSEQMVNSIPGVRSIYGAVKQVIETVSTSNSTSFGARTRRSRCAESLSCRTAALGDTTRGAFQKLSPNSEADAAMASRCAGEQGERDRRRGRGEG